MPEAFLSGESFIFCVAAVGGALLVAEAVVAGLFVLVARG